MTVVDQAFNQSRLECGRTHHLSVVAQDEVPTAPGHNGQFATGAGQNDVVAVPGIDVIRANLRIIGREHIVAVAAEACVSQAHSAVIAQDHIISGPGFHCIVADPADNHVRSAQGSDRIFSSLTRIDCLGRLRFIRTVPPDIPAVADQDIVTRAGREIVITRAANEDIIVFAALHDVTILTALEDVVAAMCGICRIHIIGFVAAVISDNDTMVAQQHVTTRVPDQVILPGAAKYHVRARAAINGIGTTHIRIQGLDPHDHAGFDRDHPAVTEDQIVAFITMDDIASGLAVDQVVSASPVDVVVPSHGHMGHGDGQDQSVDVIRFDNGDVSQDDIRLCAAQDGVRPVPAHEIVRGTVSLEMILSAGGRAPLDQHGQQICVNTYRSTVTQNNVRIRPTGHHGFASAAAKEDVRIVFTHQGVGAFISAGAALGSCANEGSVITEQDVPAAGRGVVAAAIEGVVAAAAKEHIIPRVAVEGVMAARTGKGPFLIALAEVAIEHVLARIAMNGVAAFLAEDPVTILIAVDQVISGLTIDRVDAQIAIYRVIACAAVNGVVLFITENGVIAAFTEYGVQPGVTVNRIVPFAAFDEVIALVAANTVSPTGPVNVIVIRAAVEEVVARVSDKFIQAQLPIEAVCSAAAVDLIVPGSTPDRCRSAPGVDNQVVSVAPPDIHIGCHAWVHIEEVIGVPEVTPDLGDP